MNSNTRLKVLTGIIVISLLPLLAACSNSKNQIIGRWESKQISQRVDYESELTQYTIFEFTTDGTLKLGNKNDEAIEWEKDELKYSLQDDSVIIINDKDKVEFKYTIKPSEMVIVNDSIEIQFVKK